MEQSIVTVLGKPESVAFPGMGTLGKHLPKWKLQQPQVLLTVPVLPMSCMTSPHVHMRGWSLKHLFCSWRCVCSVGCGGGCWCLQGSVPGTGAQLSSPRAAAFCVPRSCSGRCHSWEWALKSMRPPCAEVLLQTGADIEPCRATCELQNLLGCTEVVMAL